MKVLLVGGAGHVGTFITPYLRPRHALRVLDLRSPTHEGLEFVQGSATDPEALRRALEGVDSFIWLVMRRGQGGSTTTQDVQTILDNYDVNTKALHLFLYLAQEAGVKRGVYTSTMSVHFRKRESYPAEELVALAREYNRQGRRVATIKHASHPALVDREGTDTWRHFHEGSSERTLIVSPDMRVLFERAPDDTAPETLARRYLGDADLVLVAKDGYGFSGSATGESFVVESTSTLGTHGFLSTNPQMNAACTRPSSSIAARSSQVTPPSRDAGSPRRAVSHATMRSYVGRMFSAR